MYVQNYHKDQDGLSGSIPEGLSNLNKLKLIGLQKGFTGGILPSDLGRIRTLRVLDLDYNAFYGPFPTFAKSNSLQLLDINFNGFDGNLQFLRNMTNLKVAQLDNNFFVGSIPESLGDLSSLGKVYVPTFEDISFLYAYF